MHRVKYFQKWSMTEIESEINDFIRYHQLPPTKVGGL